MLQTTPAVGTFLRRLAAHMVSRRVYVSLGEREAIVATVGQFVAGYDYARLADDAAVLDPDLLRAALAAVAASGSSAGVAASGSSAGVAASGNSAAASVEGGTAATQAVVATIQLALADGIVDAADHEILYWVGDALGVPRPRLDAALRLAASGRAASVGAAPVRS